MLGRSLYMVDINEDEDKYWPPSQMLSSGSPTKNYQNMVICNSAKTSNCYYTYKVVWIIYYFQIPIFLGIVKMTG